MSCLILRFYNNTFRLFYKKCTIVLIYIWALILFGSCETMYIPSTQISTGFEKRSALLFSGNVGLCGSTARLAYSPINHFYIGLAYSGYDKNLLVSPKSINTEYESYIGTYYRINEKSHFEFQAGYGFKKYSHTNSSYYDEGNYNKYFLQGFITLGMINKSKIGLSTRFTKLKSDIIYFPMASPISNKFPGPIDPNVSLLEGGIYVKARVHEIVNMNISFGFCYSSSGDEYYHYIPVVFRMGFDILIPTKNESK